MIQAQISDIFQYPTALTREYLSFASATVHSLKHWSSQLSIAQLGDSSEAILTALSELAELQCEETLRFDLIQVLHPLIENILERLEKNFVNQGLFQSERNRDIIELTTRIRTLFADIYIDIAQRSQHKLNQHKFSLLKWRQKRNLKTARLLAGYYALKQLGLLLVQQQMLYRSALSNQWLMTHYLFHMAMKNQEHLVNINLLQGTHHVSKNIQQAYAQVLLLEIFNTHQIRPSEIHALYQCSHDWAQLVQILPRETTLVRYIIDSNQDQPPVYNRKQHDRFRPNIYVATQALLQHINLTIQNENEYLSKTEKAFFSAPLKFHVQNVLGSTIERRHERYEYSAQLQLCFSVITAHYYLSHRQDFQHTLLLPSSLENEVEQQRLASRPFSPDTSPRLDQSRQAGKLDRESKQMFATQVLDISLNGYRVQWLNSDAPPSLRTGEFILMKESTSSPWKGGVIRWIKQSVQRNYEIGLEVIGQEIYPCAAKVYANQHQYYYQPAMLVQSHQLNSAPFSIILPNLQQLKEQQPLYIRLFDQEIKVQLVKTLLMTQSFVQYELSLEHTGQQSLIGQFIQQHQLDAHHHQDA